jgi:hypothetical protein
MLAWVADSDSKARMDRPNTLALKVLKIVLVREFAMLWHTFLDYIQISPHLNG